MNRVYVGASHICLAALTRSQAGVWSMPIAAARRQPCPSGQEHAEDGGRAVGTRGPAT
ncbi:MAG: hypothetical protein GDA48_20945 [Hormoscilla sp. GM102CHS1]|nr:hypothetical protein [Hormoscilla sp. GM102CHS1]